MLRVKFYSLVLQVLKGRDMSAQGIALGFVRQWFAPCKGAIERARVFIARRQRASLL